MARNYMLDAMQGYSFVDNIYRQKRHDKLALEDREFNKQRLLKNDARLEKQDAWTDKQRGREDKKYNDQLALRDINAAEIEQIFGADIAANPQAVSKAGALLQDPERTGKIIAAHEELSKYLAAGKTPPNELTTELVNLIGAEELSGRGGDDGLTRTVESVVPSNKPGEVMIGFNVTGKDGKTYQAPMTTGASADPADNQVQSIPVKKLIEWGNGGAASAKTIALARAKLGDNSFLEAYRAANAEMAKRKTALIDYEAKKKIDVRYRSPADNGLTAPKQTVKAQEDGSFLVYDQGTQTAKVVYPPSVAAAKSAQMADQWAQEQAKGILNPMPEDKLIQAKQTEFYDQLMAGGSQEPMITVTQDGQTYQVPAAMVPQPGDSGGPKTKPEETPKKKPVEKPKENTAKSPRNSDKKTITKPDFGLTKNTGRVIIGNDLGAAASGPYGDAKNRFEELRKNK